MLLGARRRFSLAVQERLVCGAYTGWTNLMCHWFRRLKATDNANLQGPHCTPAHRTGNCSCSGAFKGPQWVTPCYCTGTTGWPEEICHPLWRRKTTLRLSSGRPVRARVKPSCESSAIKHWDLMPQKSWFFHTREIQISLMQLMSMQFCTGSTKVRAWNRARELSSASINLPLWMHLGHGRWKLEIGWGAFFYYWAYMYLSPSRTYSVHICISSFHTHTHNARIPVMHLSFRHTHSRSHARSQRTAWTRISLLYAHRLSLDAWLHADAV